MKKAPYAADFELGILGGGQLGRMLLQEAIDWDVRLAVLDPDPDAPCSHIAHRFECGSFADADTVVSFGKNCDVVSVEIEHVSIEGLQGLEALGVAVYPQAAVLATIQDKGLQKQFYREHGIPTAAFELVENKAQAQQVAAHGRYAQKLRRGGYDGRGVQIVDANSAAERFFDAPSVMETFVPFSKELAVIAARSPSGEVRTFPPVELDFNPEANLVELLFAPADISTHLAQEAAAIAARTAEAFGIVGILAVELFLTADGQLLVNECAPRPHNSGHHSIEANYTSQYAQHLRAILGWPLGDTSPRSAAAMINLLGQKGHEGPVHYQGLEQALATPGAYVHLYGKTTTRPFRKMGHITVTGSDSQQARSLARQLKDTVKVTSI